MPADLHGASHPTGRAKTSDPAGRFAARPDTILETCELSKDFAGFAAVKDVNLKIRRNTIHALIGPNGAGKTTVFNLLTKFLTPTRGRIFYNGQDITSVRPSELPRCGVGRSFQISAIFPHMSVLENVAIALQRERGISHQFWRSMAALGSLRGDAMNLLGEVGLTEYADQPAVELSYGRKRALELVTTIAPKPEILLLDEPMSGLGLEDIPRTVDLIRKFARGRTVLMVEHNLNVVANLSDTITVLQRGEVLAEGPYDVVSQDPEVIEAYMGPSHA
ncbi:MAG: ABC transporter ATP-binding protein [Alphaproteobacteria bacterium]|nr:ABC transporter ATP-binding protein [Alphaproteobacteria bacterium]